MAEANGIPSFTPPATAEVKRPPQIDASTAPNFGGETGYFPTARVVHGTLENKAVRENWYTTEIGRRFSSTQDGAARWKADYDTKVADFNAKTEARIKAGVPAGQATMLQNAGLTEQAPKLNPHVRFLFEMGNNKEEQWSEIAYRNHRNEYLLKKYEDLGLPQLIQKNPRLMDPGEEGGLFRQMDSLGYFSAGNDSQEKVDEEKKDFNAYVSDKYAGRYGVSLYQNIKDKYEDKTQERAATTFVSQVSAGRKINWYNPVDMQDYKNLKDYNARHPGKLWEGAGNMVKHLTQAFLDTYKNTAAGVAKPEIEWSESWKKPTGKNSTSKDNFLRIVEALKKADVNGELGSFSDAGRAMNLEKGLKGKGDFDDFDFEDSDKRLPPLLEEFAVEFKKLEDAGAFDADNRFIAPLASNLAGSIMGLSSLLTLPFGNDPNSLWPRMNSNIQAMMMSNTYIGKSDFKAMMNKDNPSFQDFVDKYGFEHFKRSIPVEHAFENWTKSGWPLPSTWYREDIGANAMMWEDPTMIYGGAIKLFKYAKMAKGFTAAEMLTRAAETRAATVAGIERLAREQVAVPAGVQATIDAAKARILETTGKEVDDYAALQKIYDGEALHFDVNATELDPVTKKQVPVMTDGKKGKWVAHATETLGQISNEINSTYNATKAVRSALIRTVRDSKTLVYPKTITDILEPVREWLVNNEKKSIDWSKASHKQILEAIDEGLVDAVDIKGFGPAQRSSLITELSKVKGEIQGMDKAAYARAGTNAIRLSWMTHNPITNGIRDAFGWVGDQSDYWMELAGHYAGDVQSVEVTKRLAETGRVGYGAQTVIQSGTTVNVQRTWVRAKAMTQFAAVIGWVGDSVGIAQDYIMAHKMGVGASEGSVLLGMADEYAQRAAAATKELSALDPLNVTINYKKRAEELGKIIGDCQDKFQFIKKYHSYTGAGIIDFGADLMANGGSHMAVNETMFQFFNDQSSGVGIGGAVFFGSKNIISKHSFDKIIPQPDSYIRSQTMRGRTNLTLSEINSYLPNLAPQQQAHVLDILQREYVRAKEMQDMGSRNESEKYWMHAVDTMANLFRSANKVEFHDKGIMRGIEAIYRSKRAAENPEQQQKLLEAFIKDAETQGLTGDKAHSWALAQVEQLNASDAAGVRVGAISEEISRIEQARNKMLDVNDSALHKLEQAAMVMAKELNIDLNSLNVHPIGNTPSGKKTVGTGLGKTEVDQKGNPPPGNQEVPPLEAFGKDLPAPKDAAEAAAQNQQRMVLRNKFILEQQGKVGVTNADGTVTPANDFGFDHANGEVFIDGQPIGDLIENGSLPKDARKRIDAFKKEYIRIRQSRMEIGKSVIEANNTIQKLANERKQAEDVVSTRPFREGEVIYSAADNSQITTMKKGITVWTKFSKDGKQVIETQIYLDKDVYNTATAREEIAHALTYTENMNRSRARINTHMLGQWEANPNTGIYEEKIPSIWGSSEEGMKRMDKFAQAYAESLGSADRIEWLTRYEQGKQAFKRDKSQSARLSGVLEEIIGQLYVQRSATLSPFSSRGKFSPSSPTGGWNGSSNIAGEKKGRLFFKFLAGDVTVNDFLGFDENELIGNFFNSAGIGKPIKNLSKSEIAAREMLQSATRAVNFFGRGGELDKTMQMINFDRLRELGMIPENNNSSNPFKFWRKLSNFVSDSPENARSRAVTMERFWETAQAFNEDGTPNLVRQEFNSSLDMMIADTRNHKSSIPIIEQEDSIAIRDAELDKGANAMSARFRWAASSGRLHWLDKNGMFKDTYRALVGYEANPLGEAFTHMVLTGKETKTAFGIELVRKKGQTKDDAGIIMTGSPTLEQWNRLKAYLQENTLAGQREAELGNESGLAGGWQSRATGGIPERQWEIMDQFFTSIAEGSPDSKNATNKGWVRVFTGEYQSVFTSKGSGVKGSRRLTDNERGTRSTVRKFAPYKMTVEESGLDADGHPFLDDKGQPTKKMVMYAWVYDVDTGFERVDAGWRGELKDKQGKTYWEAGDMKTLFGTKKNMNEAIKHVRSNLAMTESDGTPDKRSWQILLSPPDMVGPDGTPVKTPPFAKTKVDARHMADVIFRLIGFHTNQYQQQYKALSNLEVDLLRESKAKKPDVKKIAGIQAEIDKLTEAVDSTQHSDYQKALANIASEDGYTNELGDTPMWDTNTPFTKVRVDRFRQKPIALEQIAGDNETYGISINISSRGNDLAGIGFSSNTWRDILPEDLSGVAASHEMGGYSIATGHYHDSGYKTFLTKELYATGPKKGQPKGEAKYMLFGPRGERISGLFDTTDAAFRAAESHSAENVGKAGMDNPVEQGLAGIGWKPLSMKYVAGVRDRFISPDGVWELRKEDYTSFGSPFSLYHTETGIRVDKSIKLSFNKGKNALFLENQLKHAIEFAEQTNQVQTIIRDNRLKQYKDENIAVLHLVSDPTAENPNARKRVVKYPDNTVFYDFMRRLKENPTGDMAWAAEVRDLMIAELGDQVLTSDPQKTLEWIHNWVNTADFGHFKVEPAPGSTATPATVGEATAGMYTGYKPGDTNVPKQIAPSSLLTANADRSEAALILANLRDRTGTSTEKPRVGRKPERGQFTEELPYQEALAKYYEEYKQQDRENQALLERDVDASDINIFIKAIKDMSRDNPRYKAKMKESPGPSQTIDSIIGQRIVDKLAAIRNMPAETAQKSKGLLYQNEKGWMIQEMMYPDDTFFRFKIGKHFQVSAGSGDRGIRFRIPTLLDMGGDMSSWKLIQDWQKAKEQKSGERESTSSPYRGKWWQDWGGRMKSKEKYVEYIIFNPAAGYVSTHKTLDDANEEVLRQMFPASVREAANDTGINPTVKGPSPSRAGIIKTENDKVHYRYRPDDAKR
jgi:hypothetical protein